MGVPRAVALVLATGLARPPAGLSALAFSKIGCCGVGRSAEIRTRAPQSPREIFITAEKRKTAQGPCKSQELWIDHQSNRRMRAHRVAPEMYPWCTQEAT